MGASLPRACLGQAHASDRAKNAAQRGPLRRGDLCGEASPAPYKTHEEQTPDRRSQTTDSSLGAGWALGFGAPRNWDCPSEGEAIRRAVFWVPADGLVCK